MVFKLKVWFLISASFVSDNIVFSARKLNSTLPRIDFLKHIYVRTVKFTIFIQRDYICQNPTKARVLIHDKTCEIGIYQSQACKAF